MVQLSMRAQFLLNLKVGDSTATQEKCHLHEKSPYVYLHLQHGDKSVCDERGRNFNGGIYKSYRRDKIDFSAILVILLISSKESGISNVRSAVTA